VLKDPNLCPIATLHVESFYKPNFDKECHLVYGTTDTNHPYVKIVKSWESQDLYYVGGTVERMNTLNVVDSMDIKYTPSELKQWFVENNWTNVVAFQTSKAMHRSQMEMTIHSMKKAGKHAKLLLQPIVDCNQELDIEYETRIKSYRHLLKHYPSNIKVKLALLPLNVRMGGPREAILHALIRKNYGCSHFIVGRNHAGPGTTTFKGEKFYGPYDAHKLINKYKHELGINVISSQMMTYVENLNKYVSIQNVKPHMVVKHLSTAEFKHRLQTGQEIPSWFSFPDIVDEFRKNACSNT
jgi:sulfate adenylyltransferase